MYTSNANINTCQITLLCPVWKCNTKPLTQKSSWMNDSCICQTNKRITQQMSRRMTKQTKWPVRPAKTSISLGIRPVWSESSLSAWRNIGSLATHWVHSEDSDQTGRMPRLIWVFAGRIDHFVVFVMRRLKLLNKGSGMFIHYIKGYIIKNIRIFNGCVVRIDNSVTRATVWHHEACQVMSNSYPKWQKFSISNEQPLWIPILAYPSFDECI